MKLTIDLTEKSISDAITKLKAYEIRLKKKMDRLVRELSHIGVSEASVRFASAMYDGTNDVQVRVDQIDGGYAIVAKGQAVCFIEFGTGVYHNPSEPYPLPRPDGVVGIGEYVSDGNGGFTIGRSRGAGQGWVYGESGNTTFTRGNPAAMPMWYATEEMRRQILAIAREVFSGD